MPKPRLKPIKIEMKALAKAWGYAYPNERLIQLDPRMNDQTMLDIATHETLHVILPVLDEEAVDLAARHVANVLTRLGFRRFSEDD